MIKIECLGEVECDVYDVQTEKTNMFFGNGILLHNSIMVNFGPLVESSCINKNTAEKVAFLDKIGNTVFAKFIQSSLNELADYLNAVEYSLHMKRENICDRGIFLAKKRYILNVWNSEGVAYDSPQSKVMGIELVKSSTPAVTRSSLREAIPILMYKTEKDIQNYLKTVKTKFFAEAVENIAFPRGVTDIDKWQSSSELYISRTPIHVRAAIMYNHLLDEHKLTNKYPYIKNGDKIKFVYLKTPNTIREDVIGFHSELPVEFNLHKYIDYDVQFAKAFVQNLEAMCEPMQWELIKKSSMAQWGI